jgi:hypothetical protein
VGFLEKKDILRHSIQYFRKIRKITDNVRVTVFLDGSGAIRMDFLKKERRGDFY